MNKKYILNSIFMLIPLIGFIIGIIVLRKGIVRKDKILFYIGLGGIVFSVAFYSFVIYYGNRSEAATEGEIMFIQYQLNQAIQEIEFYHLKQGRYPDSLQQLYSLDKYAPIIDPASQRWFSKTFLYFVYRKVGSNNYTLYSSGRDMIPNTSDDIYPDKSFFESNRIGFIRESK